MTNKERIIKKLGLKEEDFKPSEIKTEDLAEMAYINSELALALLENEVE